MEQLRQLKSFLKVYQIHFQPNDCKFLEECKSGDLKTFRTAGRPNLLDEYLLKKVKNIWQAIGWHESSGRCNQQKTYSEYCKRCGQSKQSKYFEGIWWKLGVD